MPDEPPATWFLEKEQVERLIQETARNTVALIEAKADIDREEVRTTRTLILLAVAVVLSLFASVMNLLIWMHR